jgi:hypothetical protein
MYKTNTCGFMSDDDEEIKVVEKKTMQVELAAASATDFNPVQREKIVRLVLIGASFDGTPCIPKSVHVEVEHSGEEPVIVASYTYKRNTIKTFTHDVHLKFIREKLKLDEEKDANNTEMDEETRRLVEKRRKQYELGDGDGVARYRKPTYLGECLSEALKDAEALKGKRGRKKAGEPVVAKPAAGAKKFKPDQLMGTLFPMDVVMKWRDESKGTIAEEEWKTKEAKIFQEHISKWNTQVIINRKRQKESKKKTGTSGEDDAAATTASNEEAGAYDDADEAGYTDEGYDATMAANGHHTAYVDHAADAEEEEEQEASQPTYHPYATTTAPLPSSSSEYVSSSPYSGVGGKVPRSVHASCEITVPSSSSRPVPAAKCPAGYANGYEEDQLEGYEENEEEEHSGDYDQDHHANHHYSNGKRSQKRLPTNAPYGKRRMIEVDEDLIDTLTDVADHMQIFGTQALRIAKNMKRYLETDFNQ